MRWKPSRRRAQLRRGRDENHRDSPPVLSARPAEFLYRPLGAAAKSRAADAGPRPVRQRRDAAAHGACGFRALAARPRPHHRDRDGGGEGGAGRHRRGHRRGTGESDHALGRRAHPPQGHQIRRRSMPSRSSAPAGKARRYARWSRAAAPRPRMAANWSRSATRSCRRSPTPRPRSMPGTPVIHPELGDNLTFERVLVAGDPDQGFKDADAVVETTFVFGRHTGVTNEPRAIVADWNPGEQRLTVYQGTQAPHMMQNLFAKHLELEEHQVRVSDQGRGRLVRHQGTYLCRRDGDGRALETAQASDQVRRRPHRELRHRHPCPRPPRESEDRRQERRQHHRLGDRRPHRHRSLLGLSAHLGHRGQPDRQSHRRAVYLPELPRPRPRGVPEQECHVSVPRRRPSDRNRRDGGTGRACRRADRHGPAGDPASQSHCGRRPPVQRSLRHQVRGAVAPRIASPISTP